MSNPDAAVRFHTLEPAIAPAVAPCVRPGQVASATCPQPTRSRPTTVHLPAPPSAGGRLHANRVTLGHVSFVCQDMTEILTPPSGSIAARPTSRPPSSAELLDAILEELRVLIVGGVAYGVVVAGVGSRLVMLLLRVTSPSSVIGIQSDDDFTIGEFTVGGTYNLLMLGATVGVVGVGVYQLVRRWLIGPMWWRRLTTGLAAGAVAGSMLVHADGIDFRLLQPTWLAIGSFVALPFVFGTFIGPVVDRVEHDDSWTRLGRRRWALPAVLLLAFPLTVIVIVFATLIVTVLLVIGELEMLRRLQATMPYGLVVRSLWLGVAMLGLFVLIEDVVAISRVV